MYLERQMASDVVYCDSLDFNSDAHLRFPFMSCVLAPQSLLDGSRPGGQVGLKRALMMEEEDSDDEDSSAAARARRLGTGSSSASMGIGGTSAMNFSMRSSGGMMSSRGDTSSSMLSDVYRQRQQLKTTPFGANMTSK